MAYQNYHQHQRYKNQPNVLAVIVGGIFKGLWWLISLPFKKKKSKSGISLADRQHISAKRNEISNLSKSQNIIELKHAVIEADKLVDYILKRKGYSGATFADRLRSAQPYIDKYQYDAIWQGHKIRNLIAHENDKIDRDSLIQAIKMLLEYTNE